MVTLGTPDLQLRRRDLLAAGAGLTLLSSPLLAAWRQAPELAVGFCQETGDQAVRAVAASRLAAGDPNLARTGVRVTVEGLIGDRSLGRRGLRSAELKVGFPVPGVEAPGTEFRAWSWELSPVEQAGSAVRFAVPVDAGLALALELEGPLGSERFATVLSTGREAGRPKLRPGRYLIAPGAAEFRPGRYLIAPGAPELRPRRLDASAGEPLLALRVEPLA